MTAVRPGSGQKNSVRLDRLSEGAQEYSDRFWTLDPIDGTKGFLRSQQYAIALALIVDGEIVVAALGCPNLICCCRTQRQTGIIYTAVKGEGTFAVSLEGVKRRGADSCELNFDVVTSSLL